VFIKSCLQIRGGFADVATTTWSKAEVDVAALGRLWCQKEKSIQIILVSIMGYSYFNFAFSAYAKKFPFSRWIFMDKGLRKGNLHDTYLWFSWIPVYWVTWNFIRFLEINVWNYRLQALLCTETLKAQGYSVQAHGLCTCTETEEGGTGGWCDNVFFHWSLVGRCFHEYAIENPVSSTICAIKIWRWFVPSWFRQSNSILFKKFI